MPTRAARGITTISRAVTPDTPMLLAKFEKITGEARIKVFGAAKNTSKNLPPGPPFFNLAYVLNALYLTGLRNAGRF